MIFSEVYGNYYKTIATIIDTALDKPITSVEIREIVKEKAFEESLMTIPDEIVSCGKWPFLNNKGKTILTKKTYMPPTILQKRWIKSLLLDPRIKLFSPEEKGLEDVEPLFNPEVFVYYDQFVDGDPYQEEHYIEIFHMILSAIEKQLSVRILYTLKNGSSKWMSCNPVRLEYSLRDDKFRMISATKENVSTFNISKIQACQFGEKYDKLKIRSDLHDKRTVELLLKDERQALDRVMIQFSIYEKVTERIEENLYKFRLTYEAEDETDIMIRILSFGPNLKVLGPETFVDQIKNRLKVQKRCGR